MAVIRSLDIALGANSRPLQRDLRSARRQWDQYSRKIRSGFAALAKTSIAATGAAITGITQATLKTLELTDALEKNARTAGLSLASYQRLTHVFDLVGIGGEQLVKTFTNLAQKVVFARDGLTTYTREFERIGIEISELDGLSIEQIFYRVQQALRETEDETAKTAASVTLFGRAGKRAGTLLETTSDQIIEMQSRLERLGGVINTQSMIVENFNDTMDTLGKVVRARIANTIIGIFQQWSDELESLDETIFKIGVSVQKFLLILIRLVQVLWEHRRVIINIILLAVTWRTVMFSIAVFQGFKALIAFLIATAKGFQAIGIAATFATFAPSLVAAGIVALGVVIYGVVRNFQRFKDFMRSILDSIRDLWDLKLSEIRLLWHIFSTRLIQIFVQAWKKILTHATNAINDLIKIINDANPTDLFKIDFVDTSKVTASLDRIDKKITEQSKKLLANNKTARDAYRESLAEMNKLSGEFGTNFIESIIDPFKTFYDIFLSTNPRRVLDRFFKGEDYNFDLTVSDIDMTGDPFVGMAEPEIEMPDATESVDNLSLAYNEKLNIYGTNLVQSFTNSLRDAIYDSDFKSIGENLLDRITSAILESFLNTQVTNFFTNLFSRFSIFKPVPIPTAHSGGVIPGAKGVERLALVQAGELVLTEDQQKNMMSNMSGSQVNVNFNITGDVDNAVRRSVVRLGSQVASIVQSEMAVMRTV